MRKKLVAVAATTTLTLGGIAFVAQSADAETAQDTSVKIGQWHWSHFTDWQPSQTTPVDPDGQSGDSNVANVIQIGEGFGDTADDAYRTKVDDGVVDVTAQQLDGDNPPAVGEGREIGHRNEVQVGNGDGTEGTYTAWSKAGETEVQHGGVPVKPAGSTDTKRYVGPITSPHVTQAATADTVEKVFYVLKGWDKAQAPTTSSPGWKANPGEHNGHPDYGPNRPYTTGNPDPKNPKSRDWFYYTLKVTKGQPEVSHVDWYWQIEERSFVPGTETTHTEYSWDIKAFHYEYRWSVYERTNSSEPTTDPTTEPSTEPTTEPSAEPTDQGVDAETAHAPGKPNHAPRHPQAPEAVLPTSIDAGL